MTRQARRMDIETLDAQHAARDTLQQRQSRKAIRDYLSTNRPAIGRLVRGTFEICTFAEAERLSTMLASHCPDPELASIGIWELLSNAIEHGSLEIDFDTKSRHLLAGTFEEELASRALDPVLAARVVRIDFSQSHRQIRIRIEDEGPGFAYDRVLALGPTLTAPNGRGIAMARHITFSSLTYMGRGNIVVATISGP